MLIGQVLGTAKCHVFVLNRFLKVTEVNEALKASAKAF